MNIVIDLETTIRCPVGNSSGNPMWLGNKIVAAGFHKVGAGGPPAVVYQKEGVDPSVLRTVLRSANLAIGHNIKFDLLYIYRQCDEQLPRIWDTQLAEYLLSAQKHLYASLDELTAAYLGDHRLKDDEIKAMWKAGVQTEDIPKEKLVPYLEGDVINTEDIFLKQWELAEQLDLLPLMFTQMDALRATIEMNRNGMTVDWDYVDEQRIYYGIDIEKRAAEWLRQLHPDLTTTALSNYPCTTLVVRKSTKRRNL
jgi:DNA polymerase I-like protein with 3'-5' exonuclease and polymerase domains